MSPLRGDGILTGGSFQGAKRRCSQAVGSLMRKRYSLTEERPFYQSTKQKTPTPPASLLCVARVLFSFVLSTDFFLNNAHNASTFEGGRNPVTNKFSSPWVKCSKLLLILLRKASRVNQHRSVSEDFFCEFPSII